MTSTLPVPGVDACAELSYMSARQPPDVPASRLPARGIRRAGQADPGPWGI